MARLVRYVAEDGKYGWKEEGAEPAPAAEPEPEPKKKSRRKKKR